MQVVDLRTGRQSDPPTVSFWASTGAELIRATAALAGGQCDQFDVGDERISELRDRLGEDLRADLDAVPDETWLFLTNIVARLPEPGTVEDLLDLLETEPVDVWRTLVESIVQDLPGYDPDVLDQLIAGETSVDAVRAHIAGIDDAGKASQHVTPILSRPAADLVGRIHSVLRRILDRVGGEMLAEAIGPIEREVAARRAQLAAGRPVGELVVEATNGYELGDDLPVDAVLLLPSYWFRPWLIINRLGRTEVVTSHVADEHLVLPSAAPSPQLVRLCKALGDEGRLRLLRRMAGGPITLADAMDELDLAKTTAHHHLSILRQAGLVVIRGEGRDSRYAMRTHAPHAAARALEEYLGSSAATVLEDALPG